MCAPTWHHVMTSHLNSSLNSHVHIFITLALFFLFLKRKGVDDSRLGRGGDGDFIFHFIFCIMTRNSSDRLNMYSLFLLFQRSSYRCHRDLRPPFSSKQKTKEWMEELEKERIRSFSHFLIDRFFCVMYVRSPT